MEKSLLAPESLALTLNNINRAIHNGILPKEHALKEAIDWVSSRQGLLGSYHGMFAPTPSDLENGFTLMSGERVRSRAGIGHILSEEACRFLLLYGREVTNARKACERAQEALLETLETISNTEGPAAFYCCGTCTAAFWRHLSTRLFDQADIRIEKGLQQLRSFRIGDGTWRRFPFFYTVYALLDFDPTLTRDEYRYAAPVLERVLRHSSRSSKASIHRDIAQTVLERC